MSCGRQLSEVWFILQSKLELAMGGTIWRFNQLLNFAWKWFNSIFDSKENCWKWFNSIFNSKENCQDSIQKKYSIRRKKTRIQFKKYSIQNYSWLIQFNNIFNSKLFLANSIQWNIQSKSWMSRGMVVVEQEDQSLQ